MALISCVLIVKQAQKKWLLSISVSLGSPSCCLSRSFSESASESDLGSLSDASAWDLNMWDLAWLFQRPESLFSQALSLSVCSSADLQSWMFWALVLLGWASPGWGAQTGSEPGPFLLGGTSANFDYSLVCSPATGIDLTILFNFLTHLIYASFLFFNMEDNFANLQVLVVVIAFFHFLKLVICAFFLVNPLEVYLFCWSFKHRLWFHWFSLFLFPWYNFSFDFIIFRYSFFYLLWFDLLFFF